ncbi:FliM/FliN family flagellar motor switch protein [candidate division KSB1 bacterium]|nr:FliM/FliN family flagellar motor switch protein [candidate division KSB1 bacterium]
MMIAPETLAFCREILKKILEEQQPPSRPKLSLTLVDGLQRQVFQPEETIISIGRSVTNDITLNDRYVSREHTQIVARKGRFYLKDIGSTNGTFLNRQHLEENIETPLSDGDIIQIERFKLIASIEGATRKKINIALEAVSSNQTPFSQFILTHAGNSIIAQIDVIPKGTIFVEFDERSIEMLTHRIQITGRSANLDAPLQPEVVYAGLENLFLHFLEVLNEHLQQELKIKLLFSRFEDKSSNLQASLADDAQILLLVLKIAIGSGTGFLRIVLPASFKEFFVRELDTTKSTKHLKKPQAEREKALKERLSRIMGVTTNLIMRIGSIKLSMYELMSLEANQLLQFNELFVRLRNKQIEGEVRLMLMNDAENYWQGQFKHENGNSKIQVEDEGSWEQGLSEISAKLSDMPRMMASDLGNDLNRANLTFTGYEAVKAMPQSVGTHDVDDNLLKGIQVSLPVELGRIKLSLSEILSLKPGKIIELKRPVTSSVKLMIENKLIARGEIVESGNSLALRIIDVSSSV